MFRSWFDLTVDTALLGLESQGVIALRLMHLGIGGPAAQVEANRMVSEKVAAFLEAING